MSAPKQKLSEIVGKGYDGFWNCRKFYRIVKGSRGSKKSATTALWYIYFMMKYPDANVLVIRKIYATLRNSCFTDLLWAIDRLGVQKYWKATTSPLQLECIPTGQVILFRGLDEAQKLASIRVRRGYLCWVWFEEFYEITNPDEFNKVEFSIRGYIPPETGLFKQITATFNPWSEYTWIKERFFDNPDENTFTLTTTYKMNEFLGDDDRKRYEELYIRDPRNARVVCDGEWGVSEGLIYNNWHVMDFDRRLLMLSDDVKVSFGLDFGYSVSYNAFIAVAVDPVSRTLWVFDEVYEKGMTNIELAKRLTEMGYSKEVIWADAASPLSIHELQNGFIEAVDENDESKGFHRWVLPNIRPAVKGGDSVNTGIVRLQEFRMIIHPNCVNTIRELSSYCYEQDKNGKFTGKPIKEFDHCLVAGTMVLTDHGEVPIEDVEEGDMVLTHLGYRKVLASGITRPDPAKIWRVTLEDGTVLEGTEDHPMITTDGLIYLRDVSGREVIHWDTKHKEMAKQNASNMEDMSGGGTPVLKPEICKCTIDQVSMESLGCCTGISGSILSDTSPKDATSTISTETPSTTTSPILHASPVWNTCVSTPGPMRGAKHSAGEWRETVSIRASADHGMLQRRDAHGTGNMSENTSGGSANSCASTAERSSLHRIMGTTDSAPISANPQLEERLGLTTRREFVRYVVQNSQSTDIPRPQPAQHPVQTSSDGSVAKANFDMDVANSCRPVKVVSVEDTGRYEYVYDLTVDEAHDFFANLCCVSNCMDALRYATDYLYMRGKGKVSAIGDDTPILESLAEPKRKSRRVYSTSG